MLSAMLICRDTRREGKAHCSEFANPFGGMGSAYVAHHAAIRRTEDAIRVDYQSAPAKGVLGGGAIRDQGNGLACVGAEVGEDFNHWSG